VYALEPVLSVALLAILLTIFQCWRTTTRQAKTQRRVLSRAKNYRRVSYAELTKATNGFAYTNLIGAEKIGSIYLGTLPLRP
jgi:hypothetical protein